MYYTWKGETERHLTSQESFYVPANFVKCERDS